MQPLRQIVDLYPVESEDGTLTYSSKKQLGVIDPVSVGIAVVSGVTSIVKAIKAGNAQRKQIAAERVNVDAENAQLIKDNALLDDKIEELNRLFNELSKIASGLGSLCVIGCRLKKETAKYNTATAKHDALLMDQAEKFAQIDSLVSQITSLQKKLSTGNTVDLLKKIAFVGGTMIIGGIVIYQLSKQKKD
jgi:cell division protein FtsB